ncbi:MAG: ribonuclease R [Planctomycetia bacterium]|nr:ribonuclease R [Planctomycetia bacterium]
MTQPSENPIGETPFDDAPIDAASINIEQALLAYVNRPNYQPVKPRVIAKKLGLDEEGERRLKRAIKTLIKRGQIAWGVKHLVRPAAAAGAKRPKGHVPAGHETTATHAATHVAAHAAHVADRVIGTFQRTSQGDGFVRPHGATAEERRIRDIFVPAEGCQDASTGDTVVVKLSRRRGAFGRREGRVVEIVERETNRFVGTYFEEAGQGFAQVDGTLFARPVPVDDPGAKRVKSDDKIVFEMVRFPSHAHDGEGVIVEVLGARGAPGVDTLSIIREYNLPGEFPDDVLEDARGQARKFEESVPPGRLDLTGETIITIDPVDARDFDDAISLSRLDNGGWRLGVHIADVSWFVRPDSPLDREARSRATSCYLPDRVIPMLPELLSNGVCSLQPSKVRFAKTAFIEFTADGTPVFSELAESAIKSGRRFTYEEVDDFLAGPQHWRHKLAPDVFQLLERMHGLAMILRKRRSARGSLELHMPELKVDLDDEGRVKGASVVENTVSHQIIEEFMLAANEAVAEKLTAKGWPFLRRVHPAPSERKMTALTEFAEALDLEAGNLLNRFALQRLLNSVVGKPEEHAVHYAVLRSLPQAVYSPAEEGHYALATDNYCHFTSPIRRYPDLTVHRLVEALLAEKRPHLEMPRLVALGEHCSDRERRAEAAERELSHLKLLAYLADRIGEELDAVITGVEDFGLFAEGLKLPANGLIHITSLEDDHYVFDRRTHTLAGRKAGNHFRLGEHIRVAVARVDLERRQLDYRLIHKLRPHAAVHKAAAGKTAKRPPKRIKPGKHPAGHTRRRQRGRRK